MNRETIGTHFAFDFDPKLLDLFDEYVHGLIDRQHFLTRASAFDTPDLGPDELLEALNPKFAETQRVSPRDPRINAEFVELESPRGNGRVRGYLVRPVSRVPELPCVLVVHENRGLSPHIEDVTRRAALEGFIAFAPDALFVHGGYPGHEGRAGELFQSLDKERAAEDFRASADFLRTCPGSNGKLGVVGFSYGGNVAHRLASELPSLDAAVAFYGPSPEPRHAASVRAQLLVHLADHDDGVNAGWARYDEALSSAHTSADVFQYPGTQHGFHNDTTPRYNRAAAKLAWQRTVTFLNRTLRKPTQTPSRASALHDRFEHRACAE